MIEKIIVTQKFIRVLKLSNFFERFANNVYHDFTKDRAPYEKKNSHCVILQNYVFSEIDKIKETVLSNPYDKIILNQYGLVGSIKYKTIIEDEKQLIFVLFLRYCYRYNISYKLCIKNFYKILNGKD